MGHSLALDQTLSALPDGHTCGVADLLCPVVVGREAELEALRARLDRALRADGGLVFLTGEAGIGKSRLARELASMARRRGTAVLMGRAVPSGATTPYRPLTEALLSELRDRPLRPSPELAPWLPALGAILPSLVDGRPGDFSLPVQAEAVVQVMRQLAGPQGVVLVLEDLHWADPDTLAVVEYLGDHLAGTKALCVATSRDEVHTAATRDLVRRLVGRGSALELSLGRLPADLVAQMVKACMPEASAETVARAQRTAEGIPFVVEEVLASPGVPGSFRDSVRARLADFPEGERVVLSSAAVLGRQFDWRLLAEAAGQAPEIVARSLERAADHQLLRVDGESFSFRHALTREAVVERLLPPRRRALAAAALAAVDVAHPELDGPWRDLAADLALQAGEETRAATLLLSSGRSGIERGALATAIDALDQALALGNREAGPLLVEALALAGRVDEAVMVGERAIAATVGPMEAATIHLCLAHAAVAATRWSLATSHLGAATGLLAADPASSLRGRATVLQAEIALAASQMDRASGLASEALSHPAATPEIRCQALEVLGRVERLSDPGAARSRFELALSTSREHHLPLWQLRALHELGTIDMFDHAGTERLGEARRTATELGALSTVAALDLQLAAAGHARFELEVAANCAGSALALGQRLGLGQVQAKALVMLAENNAWRGKRMEMERFIGLTVAAAPHDAMLSAFTWGARGMYELLCGHRSEALEHLGRATLMLAEVPYAEPACFRAVWPVVLASAGDRRSAGALAQARRVGLDAFRLNAGLLAYADAIITGAAGSAQVARRLSTSADANFVNCTAWADVARWLAAESAASGGWDKPDWWLAGVSEHLAGHGLAQLAGRCRQLAGGPQRWAGLGITAREADVLSLVVEGLANKEIAIRLGVSARTVEKHVEALLRKLQARSRAHLVAVVEVRAHGVAT